MIRRSTQRFRFEPDEPTRRTLSDFFIQRINNSLFRHQALTRATELGINLYLWGRGWEQHPRFARFAKGIACNQSQLCAIYQASKINLQLTPTGAVHQRLLDGLAAGGFFLLRYCPGDLADRLHKKMWDWSIQHDIHTHDEFLAGMDAQVQQWLAEYRQLMGVALQDYAPDIIAHLKLSADVDFTRSAGSTWDEYDRINFSSREQLGQLVKHYLAHQAERQSIARSMRQVVINRFTYRATSLRLLDLITSDLEGNMTSLEAAA